MFQGIRWRVILYYLVVIVIVVSLMGSSFSWFVKHIYLQFLEQSLYIQATLTSALIYEFNKGSETTTVLDTYIKELGEELGLRLTVIAMDGLVLADSAENPLLMDDHSDRPEFIDALKYDRGTAIRFSSTLDEEMFYFARPIKGEHTGVGQPQYTVVRIALPLSGINKVLRDLRLFILASLIAASLVAFGAAIILSYRITAPICKIEKAAREISEGNYFPQINLSGKDELSSLAASIKETGETLDLKMNQLLWEKNKLDSVITAISNGIILVDQELRIELVNLAAEKLFEIKDDDVRGRLINEVVRHYTLIENLKAVYHHKEAISFDISLYYPHNAILETVLIPVTASKDELVGVLLLFREISGLRSVEKMRSDFVANVSHELRTPLTVIKGYTETIVTEKLDIKQMGEYLAIISRETERLSQLLNDLLDLANIENEKVFIKKDQVFLTDLIDEVVAFMQERYEQSKKGIIVTRDTRQCYIQGNYDWLHQALVNILENSIKHGGQDVSISLSLGYDRNQAVVTVKDNGPGIPKEDLPYVFERFYRVDKSRSRKTGSTGLGLSLVKHILEAHGASYNIDSVEGEGTTFIFALKCSL